MNKLGARRLLKLADILEKADKGAYNQAVWTHECGTPACALGHWAHHNRRRWELLPKSYFGRTPVLKGGASDPWQDAKDEFGIDGIEWDALFSSTGCGGARTAKQAAKYIRAFVARKQKAAP